MSASSTLTVESACVGLAASMLDALAWSRKIAGLKPRPEFQNVALGGKFTKAGVKMFSTETARAAQAGGQGNADPNPTCPPSHSPAPEKVPEHRFGHWVYDGITTVGPP